MLQRRMSLCFATSPRYPLLHICRLSAQQARNSSLKSPWKTSRRLKILVIILTAQSTSSGNRSAILMTLATSAWSCRAYWDVYRMARTPFRFAASTMSKKSKVRITTNTCGLMHHLPSRQTWYAALSIMAGVYKSAARRLVVRFRTCLFICTISVPEIR